jgi:hypothetical protein
MVKLARGNAPALLLITFPFENELFVVRVFDEF